MAMVRLLLSPFYTGSLYKAKDIAMGLNIEAGVLHHNFTEATAVNMTLLLHTFSNSADEYSMKHDNVFNRPDARTISYIRRKYMRDSNVRVRNKLNAKCDKVGGEFK